MNEHIPRIALFRTAEKEEFPLAANLQRFNCEVFTAASLADLADITESAGASPDAIVVPLRIFGGMNGVNICLQIRAHETLTTVPIVALSSTRESAVIRSLYGAGADVVMSQPVDVEALHLQVLALGRQRRSLDEHLASMQQNSGLKRSIYEALNAVREGVLVFDTAGELAFLNERARELLGIEPALPPHELGSYAAQFVSHLDGHFNQELAGTTLSEGRGTFTRADGRAIPLGMRIKTIFGADESPSGAAVALTDLNQIAQLGSIAAQDQRTRSLALLAGAGTLQLLAALGGPGHSVIAQIEGYLAQAPAQCHLAATVTALLEFIDPALNSGARVKVNLTTDAVVAVPAAEVFQLTGHLILHSVARAGVGGETTISASINGPRLELQVSSELGAHLASQSRDIIGRLLHGSWSERAAHRSVDGFSMIDFEAARGISQKNGLTLKERPVDGSRVSYIVSLPLSGVPNRSA
jgi:DNA-binding response OmpR family regulator